MRVRRENFTKTWTFILATILDLLGWIFLHAIRLIKPEKRTSEIKDFRNILLIRLDNIGDVLTTTPSIKALRRLYPGAHISCLINPKSRDVLDGNANIDEIITIDAPWYHGWRLTKVKQVFKVIRDLQKKNFDLIISFRPGSYHYDHLLSYLIGAPRRVGYGVKGGGFLLTDVVPFEEEKHAIEMALDIVRYLGGNGQNANVDIYLSPSNKAYAEQLLKDNGISPNDLIVGLNPCASHPLIWTVEGFAEVGEALVKQYGAKIIFIGTLESHEYIENIRNAMSVESISLSGKTNLKELTALIAKLDLLISVDSAPRFLASAVGTPVIFLRNGGNSSIIWGPWGKAHYMVKHDVPCAPCGNVKKCKTRECMTKITPQEVLATVDRVFPSIVKKRLKQE